MARIDRDSLRMHLNALAADLELNGLGYYAEHIQYIIREFVENDRQRSEPKPRETSGPNGRIKETP